MRELLEMIIKEDEGYQGWKNYATWGVALIIDNEQGYYNRAIQMVDEIMSKEDKELVRVEVADALKAWVEDEPAALDGLSDMQQQLINAALSDVDWMELADHYITTWKESKE